MKKGWIDLSHRVGIVLQAGRFFNNWFFTTGYIDLGIKAVRPAENSTSVVIVNAGGLVAPVDLILTYDDGTTARFHQTPAMWMQNKREAAIEIPSKKKVIKLVLDDGIFIDANLNEDKSEIKVNKIDNFGNCK